MSHYNDFKTQITDEEALLRALCRVDFHNGTITRKAIEVHKTPQRLQGYDQSNRTAHVIIRQDFNCSYNDMGFLKDANNNYKAQISDRYDQKWLGRLTMFYNIEKSKMEFNAKGIECIEAKDAKGRIQLRAKFPVRNNSKIQIRMGSNS